MKKNNLVRSVCVILTVIMFSCLITAPTDHMCDNIGCDSESAERNQVSLHDQYVLNMNSNIEENCCCSGFELTRDQMAICINNFENIQKNYSGKLMCEEDGEKYYYPVFILDIKDENYKVTKNTRYRIEPLNPRILEVHEGIVVTAYEAEEKELTELELNVKEMNEKLFSFEAYGLTKEEMEKRVAEFESFDKEYSKKYLCKDNYGRDVYCPQYSCRYHEDWFEDYNFTENTRYQIVRNVHSMKDNGIISGLRVEPYELDPGAPAGGLM